MPWSGETVIAVAGAEAGVLASGETAGRVEANLPPGKSALYLWAGLKAIGYDRVTFMECAGVPEAAGAKSPEAAIRFMRYYRALWTELCR